MSDTIFYSIFASLFGFALCLQALVCYRIGVFGKEAMKPEPRYIFVDSRKSKCELCNLDNDDWKVIQAEPAEIL